ncbi:MAG: hypothetical protein ACYC96_12705 [Fimbriimonadaceae bacterium]
MRFQDFICETTQASADAAFKAARAVAADKLNWKPLDEGRSVLDQAQELAQCPYWAESIVADRAMPEMTDELRAQIKAERDSWTTIDICQVECNKRLASLFALYRGIPDEQLDKTKWLPFDGGRDFTWKEMMDYPNWNFVYHLGQISYIQTLYGDKEMH